MIKKIVTFAIFMSTILNCSTAIANTNIAVVDIQKIVNNSNQIKALKKEQETKKKEIAQFIKKAGEEINPEVEIHITLARKKGETDKEEKLDDKTKQEENKQT